MTLPEIIEALEAVVNGYINFGRDYAINIRHWPTVVNAKKAIEELKQKLFKGE